METKYKVYYSENFGETYEFDSEISTVNIYGYMSDFSEELSYQTHEWEYDENEFTVYDDYGNIYRFEKAVN